jgi:hypothetical protein
MRTLAARRLRDAFNKAGWPIYDDTLLAKAGADGFTPAQVPDIVAQWRKAEERKRKAEERKPKAEEAPPQEISRPRSRYMGTQALAMMTTIPGPRSPSPSPWSSPRRGPCCDSSARSACTWSATTTRRGSGPTGWPTRAGIPTGSTRRDVGASRPPRGGRRAAREHHPRSCGRCPSRVQAGRLPQGRLREAGTRLQGLPPAGPRTRPQDVMMIGASGARASCQAIGGGLLSRTSKRMASTPRISITMPVQGVRAG